MCVNHVLINICSPLINISRGKRSVDSSEMAEDAALLGSEERLSASTINQIGPGGFGGVHGRYARDDRVHS